MVQKGYAKDITRPGVFLLCPSSEMETGKEQSDPSLYFQKKVGSSSTLVFKEELLLTLNSDVACWKLIHQMKHYIDEEQVLSSFYERQRTTGLSIYLWQRSYFLDPCIPASSSCSTCGYWCHYKPHLLLHVKWSEKQLGRAEEMQAAVWKYMVAYCHDFGMEDTEYIGPVSL